MQNIILVIEAGTSFMSHISHCHPLSSFIPLQLLYCIYCNMKAEDFSINNRTAVTSVRIVARTTGKNSYDLKCFLLE